MDDDILISCPFGDWLATPGVYQLNDILVRDFVKQEPSVWSEAGAICVGRRTAQDHFRDLPRCGIPQQIGAFSVGRQLGNRPIVGGEGKIARGPLWTVFRNYPLS